MFADPPERQERHQQELWGVAAICSIWSFFQQVCAFNSPVIFRLEVANRYEASSAAHGEFILQRRPLHERGGAVDPEDDESGLPHAVLLAPHVRVAIRSAGYNPIAFRSPVDALRHAQHTLRRKATQFSGSIFHITC